MYMLEFDQIMSTWSLIGSHAGGAQKHLKIISSLAVSDWFAFCVPLS